MFCKCKKGVKAVEIDAKTLRVLKVDVECMLNDKIERLSVKACRHCVFYPFSEILKQRGRK